MPKSKSSLDRLSKLCNDGKLVPKVDALLPFTEKGCQEAFASLQGRKTAGKIVIQIGQSSKI